MVARLTRLWLSFNFQDGAIHVLPVLPSPRGSSLKPLLVLLETSSTSLCIAQYCY